MQGADHDGNAKANGEVDDDLSPPLLPVGIQIRPVDVEDDGQTARDGHGRRGNAGGGGPQQLGLDIAEAGAVPPVLKVLIRPNEDVDDDEEVED